MKTQNHTSLGIAVISLAFVALFPLSSSPQEFRKMETFTVHAAKEFRKIEDPKVQPTKKDDKPQQDKTPGWQKIVLDRDLFTNVWSNAEFTYKMAVAIGGGAIRLRDAEHLLSIPLVMVEESKVTPEALQRKYGKGQEEVSEYGDDKGVTYHVYGPLAFGIRSGDKYFTFLRAERRLFEEGFTKAAETSAIVKAESTAGAELDSKPRNWPKYSDELLGSMEVRVKNPNEFKVRVGLRSDTKGRDFIVAPNGTESVRVPNGRYDIYFQYSSDADGLYQGDSFTLKDNGVEIQIVKVVNGNYGIRKVK